jgi:hypothetical protein
MFLGRSQTYLFCTVIKLIFPPLLVIFTQLSFSTGICSFSFPFPFDTDELAAGGSGDTSPSSFADDVTTGVADLMIAGLLCRKSNAYEPPLPLPRVIPLPLGTPRVGYGWFL